MINSSESLLGARVANEVLKRSARAGRLLTLCSVTIVEVDESNATCKVQLSDGQAFCIEVPVKELAAGLATREARGVAH
ncbi:MAG: hypothetical protein WD793_10820 [Steroidobacteraceae bacterium]